MFKKVLVAVDRSEMKQAVFNRAMAIAKPANAEVLLLHVLTAEESGSPDMFVSPGLSYYPVVNDSVLSVYREQWQQFEEQGLDTLRSLASIAEANGVDVSYRQVAGSPGRVICSIADEWDADLIIMGRRGLSAIREMLLGSVSNYVLHHAACSMLTVHVEPDEDPANAGEIEAAQSAS
jgi:nucleotide-binding universal stress UspA family protein